MMVQGGDAPTNPEVAMLTLNPNMDHSPVDWDGTLDDTPTAETLEQVFSARQRWYRMATGGHYVPSTETRALRIVKELDRIMVDFLTERGATPNQVMSFIAGLRATDGSWTGWWRVDRLVESILD